MATIEQLRDLNDKLDQYLSSERSKKEAQEDKKLLITEVGGQLKDIISPILEAMDSGNTSTIAEFRTTLASVEGLTEKIALLLNSNEQSNQAILSAIKAITITAPEVNVPAPKVTVTVPKIDTPKVDVSDFKKSLDSLVTEIKKPVKVTVKLDLV